MERIIELCVSDNSAVPMSPVCFHRVSIELPCEQQPQPWVLLTQSVTPLWWGQTFCLHHERSKPWTKENHLIIVGVKYSRKENRMKLGNIETKIVWKCCYYARPIKGTHFKVWNFPWSSFSVWGDGSMAPAAQVWGPEFRFSIPT